VTPYAAQGATSSIEDAAVLAGCLEYAKTKGDIPSMTRAYEEMRKGRVDKVKKISRENMKRYGLPNGKEQEDRDRIFAKTLVAETTTSKVTEKPEKNINADFGTPEFSMWLYGYDVEEELAKYFGRKTVGR
jgi:salicylate hydroxylase